MRLILTSFIIVIATNVSAFKYQKVYRCSQNLHLDSLEISDYDNQQEYYIHFGDNDDYVIYHLDYYYTTYEEKRYEQLWVRNYAITKLIVLENMGQVIKFEMQHVGENYRKTFTLNLNDLTYLSRGYRGSNVWQPEFGICKLEFSK